AAADVTYANLEGPTAGAVSTAGREVPDPGRRFDGVAYSSYPQVNYHPSLVTDVRDSGIDVVSTANNHSLDRRALGADRTIGYLATARLPFTGTRTSEEAAARSPEQSAWSTLTREGGFTLAWIACTYDTNGIKDPHRQVLLCYGQ